MRRTILRLSSIAILMAGSELYAQNAAIAPTYPSPSSWGGSTGTSNRGGYNSTTGYAIGGGSQNGVPTPSGGRPAALMDSSMVPAGVITTTNMAPMGNTAGATSYERPIGSVGSPTMGSALMGGPVSPIRQANAVAPAESTGVAQPGTTWVESSEASCCGPVGKNGPIGTEFIIRTGPVFAVGGGLFKDVLNTGLQFGGVGRTLFYDKTGSSAFLVDLGLMYTYYNGGSTNPLFIYDRPATVRALHKTQVQVGFGKEWYMNGPGFLNVLQNSTSHFGIDAGGRYGTSHVDLTTLNSAFTYARLHAVIGGAYVGASYGMDVPLGGYIFNFGLRGEYAYTNSDILPQNSDQHELSLFLTFGMRY